MTSKYDLISKKPPALLQHPRAKTENTTQTEKDQFQKTYYRMNFLTSGAGAAKILDQEYRQVIKGGRYIFERMLDL